MIVKPNFLRHAMELAAFGALALFLAVAGQPLLAGLQELLRPRVIKAVGDALAPAQFGNRVLAAKAR